MRTWAAANLGESGQCVRSYADYQRVRGSGVSVGESSALGADAEEVRDVTEKRTSKCACGHFYSV